MTTSDWLHRKPLLRGLTAVLILFLLVWTPLWAQDAPSGVRWVVSQGQIPPVAWGVYDLESQRWVNRASGRWGSASAPPGQYSVYVRWTPESPLEWWAMVEVYDGTFTPLQTRQPLALFSGIAQLVQNAYVEPPRMEQALDGALVAMIESLDPYSSYVNAATFKALDHGHQASPGLIVNKLFGYLYVVSVVEGSPAEEAGLYTGTLIESINGTTTAFMSLWEAEQRLKGPPDTRVELRVVRARSSEPVQLHLLRSLANPPDVAAEPMEDGIVRLHVPHLGAGVALALESILSEIDNPQTRGLIVDLRGTAQGLLKESVDSADLFLDEGATIMTLSGRGGRSEEFVAEKGVVLADVPMVVLIDRGTSGAAEILAAALEDHGRAETLGMRSIGNGGVQERQDLEDGAVLLLTTRKVVRSTGSPLQSEDLRKSGIKPSLRWPDQNWEMQYYYDHLPAGDAFDLESHRDLRKAILEEQLRKAIERIRDAIQTVKKAA